MVGLGHEELDITRLRRRGARACHAERPQALINCAAWTDVDGAESNLGEAIRVNGDGARNLAAATAMIGCKIVLPSTDYVFDGTKEEPYVESDPVNPMSAYGKSKLAGEGETIANNPRHFIVRSSWLFGVNGKNFVDTMLNLGRTLDEVAVVKDQVGCPTYTGHLAEGLVRLVEWDDFGIFHMAGGGECSWYEFAIEIFEQAGVECRVLSQTTDMLDRPAPRPRVFGARERARPDGAASRLARGAGRIPRRASASTGMRIVVTGGAGFIGSNFVRHILQEHPDDSVVVLDKLTYAGRMESLQDLMTYERMEFVQGDICDPVAVRAALENCDAVVNFAAESHVDRSIDEPGHFIQTDVFGTYVLLEEVRRAGVERYLQVSTDEVYGSIPEGSFTEQSPLDPSSPYSASKAGGDLVVAAYCQTFGVNAVVCRSSNNYGPYQYPEKLIPLCILNALHGDPLPVYGDGMQVRNWLYVTDNCRALDTALRKGDAGRGLQHRRPGRAAEHRRRPQDPGADRARRVADRVREGPARARPALLAQLGEDRRARLDRRGRVRGGTGENG